MLAAWVAPESAAAQDGAGVESCMTSYEAAQRLRINTQLREARKELLTCGGAACPQALRKDCLRWLDEVDRSLPSLVIAVRSGNAELTDVRVSVDGTQVATRLDGAALTVDPGSRLFRFEASGYEPLERTIVVREGEKNRAVGVEMLAVGAPAASGKSKAPALIVAAVGVVGLGFFTYFGLKGRSEKSDLEPCKGHCAQSDVDRVSRDFLVADISLGIGVVALGAAAYLYFSDRSPRQAPATAAQRPWWLDVTSGRTMSGASVGWRF